MSDPPVVYAPRVLLEWEITRPAVFLANPGPWA